jgi:hypothetical protein
VAWVEGWTLPPEPTYDVVPEGRPAREADRTAFGRLGFPNGAVCTIPPPLPSETAHSLPVDIPDDLQIPADGWRDGLKVEGTNGAAFLMSPAPVLFQGGPLGSPGCGPITPDFLADPDW